MINELRRTNSWDGRSQRFTSQLREPENQAMTSDVAETGRVMNSTETKTKKPHVNLR